jgi:hypothetical protein
MALPSSLARLEEEIDAKVKEIDEGKVEAGRIEAEEEAASEPAEKDLTTTADPEPDEKPDPRQESDPLQQTIASLEAEVKKLDNDNRTQRIRRGELERRVESLEKENESLKAEVARKPVQPVLSDEDRELLEAEGISEDVLNVIGKTLKGKDSNEDLDKLRKEIGTIKAQSAEDKFYNEISNVVPNWKTINVDPGFIKWLQNEIPFQNCTVHDRLNAAGQQFDSATVAKIFKSYADSKVGAPAKKSLKDVIEPTSKRVGTQTSKDGKIWKRADVTKFYSEAATGKYSDEEVARIEKEIASASAEGRIK